MTHWDRRELNKLIAVSPEEYKKKFPEPFSAMIPEDASSENKLATEAYVNEHGGGGGTSFTPEDDDLSLDNSVLKLADRPYNSQTPNGLGYKILRKDATFASQVTDTNTIYEIRYNFNLGGGTVNVPSGCALRFDGGKLIDGTITGNKTVINSDACQIFDNIDLAGTWENSFVFPEWFKTPSDTNDSPSIQKAVDTFGRVKFISGRQYVIDETIHLPGENILMLDEKSIQSRTGNITTFDGLTILKANAYPVFQIEGDGVEIINGLILCETALTNTDVVIKIDGSAEGTLVEKICFRDLHIQAKNATVLDTNTFGTGILLSKENYGFDLHSVSFYGFAVGMNVSNSYNPNWDVSFNLCKQGAVLTLCRNIRLNIKVQARITANYLTPYFVLDETSGFMDGRMSDFAIVSGSNHYQANPLKVVTAQVTGYTKKSSILYFGENLRNILSNYYTNLPEISFPFHSFISPNFHIEYPSRIVGGGVINSYYNLFDGYIRNVDYSVTFSPKIDGNNTAYTSYPSNVNAIFQNNKEYNDTSGLYLFQAVASYRPNCWCKFEFNDKKFHSGKTETVSTTVEVYNLGVIFKNQYPNTLTILPDVVIFDFTVASVQRRVFVWNRYEDLDTLKTMYDSYITGQTNIVFSQSGEFDDFVTPPLNGLTSGARPVVSNVSITILGVNKDSGSQTIGIYKIFATTIKNFAHPMLGGDNTFLGANDFNGNVNINGNLRLVGGSTRPTSPQEGIVWYDSSLKMCILWNGTAWVNMDGTALS